MIAEGLLWFDDDPRRPLTDKMAEAARRFSERTGWVPTACEANPQTLAQRVVVSATGRTARAKAAVAPEPPADMPRMSVTPNPARRPNEFLVGVEAGKTPRRARLPKPTPTRQRAEKVKKAS